MLRKQVAGGLRCEKPRKLIGSRRGINRWDGLKKRKNLPGIDRRPTNLIRGVRSAACEAWRITRVANIVIVEVVKIVMKKLIVRDGFLELEFVVAQIFIVG